MKANDATTKTSKSNNVATLLLRNIVTLQITVSVSIGEETIIMLKKKKQAKMA